MNLKKIKKICLSILLNCFVFAFAFSVVPEQKGIVTLDFNGCKDGSVHVEATVLDSIAPAKDFELKIPLANDNFVFNGNKGTWNSYQIEIIEDGYVLSYKNKKIYKSNFFKNGTKFVEARTWLTAKSFYGFGEASSTLSLNGQSFTIYNEAKYGNQAFLFVPFFVTNQADSSYYNANGKDAIVFQENLESCQEFTTRTGRIDSYYKKCDSIKTAVSDFYAVSGSSSLLPKWAFGFIQSKYGYKSQDEVVSLVNEFKKNDIKLSAVVLDLYWFDKMGDIYWNTKKFPNPKELDSFLESNGVKLITITEPFFTVNSNNYKTFLDKNFFGLDEKGSVVNWSDWWCLGDKYGSIINPIHKDSTEILGEKYSKMLDSGIDGFWTDLGEPEKAPSSVTFNGVSEQYFHNYYNYYWSKAIFDGVTKRNPDKRLFMLSRSGYTGSTAFNVSVWSGDVSVSFDSLAKHVALGVSSGMCGLPYWGSDVGGFVPQRHNDELLVRWYQFGAFTPVFRAHGTGSREPWVAGNENLAIIKKYIDIRYLYLPYTYSLARESEVCGLPMMRPMLFESEKAPAWCLDTQYMFGPSILVSPVVKPASESTKQKVWLPKGNWYEFETLNKVKGGKTITVNTQMDSIPVYIKEGAILPLEQDGKNVLLLLPGKKVENNFVWYDDDGVTNQYKNGIYEERTCSLKDNVLKISGNKTPMEIILALPASYKLSEEEENSWIDFFGLKIKTVKLTEDFEIVF